MNRRFLLGVLYALLGLMLLACEPKAEKTEEAEAKTDDSVASVMVDNVNYEHKKGMKFYLYDITGGKKTPIGASIVDPLSGGGSKECCVSLPKTWHAGMMIRVEWQDSDFERTYPEINVKELEIPRYESPADLYVVFYPEHEVEVVVSSGEPGHPSWRGRIKQSPWNTCVAEFGRKVCLRAIPKAGLDLEEMRGFCLSDTLKPGQCDRLLRTCIKDYEDPEMCNKLVWDKKQ
jgi:hypothetical protein